MKRGSGKGGDGDAGLGSMNLSLSHSLSSTLRLFPPFLSLSYFRGSKSFSQLRAGEWFEGNATRRRLFIYL